MTDSNEKDLSEKQANNLDKNESMEKFAMLPGLNAATVIAGYGQEFGELSIFELSNNLSNVLDKFTNGNTFWCESMLLNQANALQAIFMNLSRRAAITNNLAREETLLRLAFKAQNQCRSTLQTLTAAKKPPTVFAKQANIAQGHQQVNNTNSPDSSDEKK